jgi:hypothetical protein
VDPFDEHRAFWQALVEREWMLVEPERLKVIGDGGFRVPLMQGLLGTGRLEEMRRARKDQRDQPAAIREETVPETRL